MRRVWQLERPRCLRQGAACACAEGVRITGGERVQRSVGRPRRSRQCVIVCASRGVQGVASSRSSACVAEELDVCRGDKEVSATRWLRHLLHWSRGGHTGKDGPILDTLDLPGLGRAQQDAQDTAARYKMLEACRRGYPVGSRQGFSLSLPPAPLFPIPNSSVVTEIDS